MRKLLCLVILAVTLISATEKKTIKIACMGDSITMGYGIDNPNENSYPAQLQQLLGDGFHVKNIGILGATTVKEDYSHYRRSPEYEQMVVKYQPDIVIVGLGTYDARLRYRSTSQYFERDYSELIAELQERLPNARIIVLTPPKGHMDGEDDYMITNIIPTIRKVANKRNVEVIDLYHFFADYSEDMMYRKAYPTAKSVKLISQRVYEHLTLETEDYNFETEDIKPTNFHGYDCFTFEFKGKVSHVVKPKQVAKGRPWIWRSRFWDKANASVGVDVALLERGYHLVYTDVVDMFGNKKAVKQFEQFHKYLTDRGLNQKCIIEGMSRGGLMIYNFAVENPDKVAAVYADAPFLNFNIFGDESKTVKVKDKLFKAYGFKKTQDALDYMGTPINRAEEIAKAGFKIIHVCGTADESVPLEDNTLLFKQKLEQAGGTMTYIEKVGAGHHPHSLENYEPIVDFLLKAYK